MILVNLRLRRLASPRAFVVCRRNPKRMQNQFVPFG